MPGEPPPTAGSKSSKAKRISIPRVQSSTDTELQSQQSQSGSTPLQPALHYVTFRSELEDSPIPPALRCRLYDLFQQIEKEFEMLYTENLGCKYLLPYLFISSLFDMHSYYVKAVSFFQSERNSLTNIIPDII